MANIIIKLKVLPKLVETDFDKLTKDCTKKIASFGGKVLKNEKEPIAFGMNALILYYLVDEARGGTEKVEQDVLSIKEVSSVDVVDVRRAIG